MLHGGRGDAHFRREEEDGEETVSPRQEAIGFHQPQSRKKQFMRTSKLRRQRHAVITHTQTPIRRNPSI